jgi:hypothetical protein
MRKYILCLFLSLCPTVNAYSEDVGNDMLFNGIIEQLHDNSCGAAALSSLINGTNEHKHVTELEVVQVIKSVSAAGKNDEQGYSLLDLKNASEKLGYYAEWRKIGKEELPKISQPVILLIGINTDYPHYVILKGIINGEAYLADSIRGNIRVPYVDLIKESISTQYPAWYVMGINTPPASPKDSVLYLSKNESDRHKNHVTAEQSNAITLATLSKKHQVIVDYDFAAALGNDKLNSISTNSRTLSHALNIRYGISDALEMGGEIQYSDSAIDVRYGDDKVRSNGSSRQYSLYVNNRFKLDDAGKTNLILGVDTSYTEQDKIWGGSFNVIGYQNTSFAQFLLGGSIGTAFSHTKFPENVLPEYAFSYFIGANKPLGDRYLAAVTLAVKDGKNNNERFERSYVASTGLTYVLNKKFQISPSFSFAFGAYKLFSLGLDIAYVGGW